MTEHIKDLNVEKIELNGISRVDVLVREEELPLENEHRVLVY